MHACARVCVYIYVCVCVCACMCEYLCCTASVVLQNTPPEDVRMENLKEMIGYGFMYSTRYGYKH